MTKIPDDMLLIAEAAQRKGVSRAAVYKAIAQGRLPAEQVQGHLALRVAALEAWRPQERKGRRIGTPMSDEGKARISEGQKRRWAQRKGDAAP